MRVGSGVERSKNVSISPTSQGYAMSTQTLIFFALTITLLITLFLWLSSFQLQTYLGSHPPD